MASQKNDTVNIMENKNDNEAIKENYIISKLLDSVKSPKSSEQEISITPVIQVNEDISDKARIESDNTPIVQISAELLPQNLKGFTPFRGFRKLDKAKIMELVSSTEELLKGSAKFVDTKDVRGTNIVDVTLKTVNSFENNTEMIEKTIKNVCDDVIKSETTGDINVSVKSVNIAGNVDIFEEVPSLKNNNVPKIKNGLRNRGRKRRKLVLKKRHPINAKAESVMDDHLYKRIYQQCLDFVGDRECNRMFNLTTEGASTGAAVEVESLLNMALETIDKLQKDDIEMKKEIKVHQKNQKTMLKKLIHLLKENVPVNGESNLEAISSDEIPSSSSEVLGSSLHKLKTNFYGFRSINPQTRDRGGAITAERLFAESPPVSPVRGAGASAGSLTIQHLDFVFRPPSDIPSDSICIKEPSNELNEDNQRLPKLKGRIVKGNDSTVASELSLGKKNSRRNVINRNRNNIKGRVKRGEEMYKSSQLEGKLGVRLKQLPRRGIKSLFARRGDPSKLRSSSWRRSSEEISNAHGSTRRLSTGSLQDSCGLFGAPRKSSAESAFDAISVPSSVRSQGRRHSAAVRRGIKRKSDKDGYVENGSKVFCKTSDIKASRSDCGITTRASDIGDWNSDRGKTCRPPVATVKPTSACSQYKAKTNELINIISKQTLLNNNQVENHSNKMNLNMDNSKIPTLYYPVHPFISHDLPVHFIPIDANKIPPYLPLYSPEFNSNSAVPIYPSFIRTRPSTDQEPSPAKYVLAKGISTRSIPHRSFSEDKVRQNLFQGISTPSGDRCPLIPKVDKSLSFNDVKFEEFEHPKPLLSPEPTLSSHSTDASVPNTNEGNPNQKIHKCAQCDFVTPKLGVLKRHELLTHSKGNSVPNAEIFPNRNMSPFSRNLPTSRPVGNHMPSAMLRGATIKKVESSQPKQKNIFKELHSFSGFPDGSSQSPFVDRLLSVSLSPLKRKTN